MIGANESLIRIMFELLPVFLASLAFVYCSLQVSKRKSWREKIFFTLACVNCVLLMSAQISWTWTVYIGDTIGTLLANYTWTVFNSMVMVNYLIISNKPKE